MTETSPNDLNPKFNKPFVEHLDDLRKVLFRIVIIIVAAIVCAIPCAPYILDLIYDTMARSGRDPHELLQTLEITGGFVLGMKLVLWTAAILSLPFVIVCITQFVFPGLRKKERRGVTFALWSSVILFATGVYMCFQITLPVAVNMMFKFNDWIGVELKVVELANYVSFVLKLMLAFGAAFELPVVILTLGSIGIVTSAMLREYRRHAMVVMLVSAMILTPPDIFTQVMMAVPMIVLYEICVWAIYIKEKRAKKSRS